jgi:hypothetical protein
MKDAWSLRTHGGLKILDSCRMVRCADCDEERITPTQQYGQKTKESPAEAGLSLIAESRRSEVPGGVCRDQIADEVSDSRGDEGQPLSLS